MQGETLMIRKNKQVRKRRGYRTHGYGRIGRHRNKGQQGGFGNTGLKKGKKIWRIKIWAGENTQGIFGHVHCNPPNRL